MQHTARRKGQFPFVRFSFLRQSVEGTVWCCNVLQHVALCCIWNATPHHLVQGNHHIVLQSTTLCCVVLNCAAVCCGAWQCVAVCCSVLQFATVCGSVMQLKIYFVFFFQANLRKATAALCCSALQCVAICCSGLALFYCWNSFLFSFLRQLAKGNHRVVPAKSQILGNGHLSVLQCIGVCCGAMLRNGHQGRTRVSNTHTHMSKQTHTHIYTYIHNIDTPTHMHLNIYIYIRTYVYTYIYIYVYI